MLRDILDRFTFKQKVAVLFVIFILFVTYSIFTVIERTGKEKVSVTVIPNDAIIYLDNKQINKGDIYLKKGTYTFSAKKKGFKTDTQIIKVSDKEISIGLLPTPESEEAKAWLRNNPTIQTQREGVGGDMAALRGRYIEEQTPLIKELPYTDINAPFSIDYGASPTRKYGVIIYISDSTPRGRQLALNWIKQQGANPTDLEIYYNDFTNPITEEGE